jgi:hypothetical protein
MGDYKWTGIVSFYTLDCTLMAMCVNLVSISGSDSDAEVGSNFSFDVTS